MEIVNDNFVMNKILGLFQTYQKTGICSRLILETMGGALTANLSVQCPTSTSPGWTSSSQTKPSRRITPSRRKRNQARREEWLTRKFFKKKDTLDAGVKNNGKDVNEDKKKCENPTGSETSKNKVVT